MDQRQLVKRLEEHFKNEEQAQLDHRMRVHEERGSQTDDDWWDELIERTKSIRPQMLGIFERNKSEMIANRFKTASCELGFREKMIQKRVMEMLPHITAIRAEMSEHGDLTDHQVQLAQVRLSEQVAVIDSSKLEPSKEIGKLIDEQLRRQEERN